MKKSELRTLIQSEIKNIKPMNESVYNPIPYSENPTTQAKIKQQAIEVVNSLKAALKIMNANTHLLYSLDNKQKRELEQMRSENLSKLLDLIDIYKPMIK